MSRAPPKCTGPPHCAGSGEPERDKVGSRVTFCASQIRQQGQDLVGHSPGSSRQLLRYEAPPPPRKPAPWKVCIALGGRGPPSSAFVDPSLACLVELELLRGLLKGLARRRASTRGVRQRLPTGREPGCRSHDHERKLSHAVGY
jgi:hypothetical protein